MNDQLSGGIHVIAPVLETHDMNNVVVNVTRLSTGESFELVGVEEAVIKIERPGSSVTQRLRRAFSNLRGYTLVDEESQKQSDILQE